MNKYFLALIFVFLKFVFVSLSSLPWPLFDPLLVCAVLFTFFHSLEARGWVMYVFFCGILRDVLSADVFGLYLFSFLFSCFAVSMLVRLIYRHNWIFVFPVIFVAVGLNYHILLFFKTVFLTQAAGAAHYSLFLGRVLLESAGSTALAYPLFLFAKRCAPELIG